MKSGKLIKERLIKNRLKLMGKGALALPLFLCARICTLYASVIVQDSAEEYFMILKRLNAYSVKTVTVAAILLLYLFAFFFTLCACSVIFTVKGKYYELFLKAPGALQQDCCLKTGYRAFCLYAVLLLYKAKTAVGALLPCFVDLFLLAAFLNGAGLDWFTLAFCGGLTVISFLLAVFGCRTAFQKYRFAELLLWLDPKLAAKTAVKRSAALSRAPVKTLITREGSILPKRLLCCLVIPAVYFLPEVLGKRAYEAVTTIDKTR